MEDYIYDDAQSEWIVPRILAIWNAGKRSEDNYLPEGVNSRMASVSPLWDSDFSGLPRTLLITAQYDYLTSQAKILCPLPCRRPCARYLGELLRRRPRLCG